MKICLKLQKLQRKAFYYCQEVDHPALFLTMRARKTVLTLTDLLYQNLFPVLICAPLSTLTGWEEDLERLDIPKSEYEVISGTKRQKNKLIDISKAKSFLITNKEFYISIPELIHTFKFKSVVLDESTCIKNYRAAITEFYTTQFATIKRRYILTGTPITSHEMDIYCQLKFLDSTIFPEKNFWTFKTKYFYQSWINKWEMYSNKKAEFYHKLNSKCCFVTLSDLRKSIGKEDLKTERTVRTFQFSKRIQKMYDTLKNDFIVSLDEENLFGFQNILQKLIYMRKLCSGYLTLNPETKETKLVDLSKFKLLMDTLETEIPDYKCIILCNFYDEINEIEKLFKQKRKSFSIITGKTKSQARGDYCKAFQEGSIQYIIVNAECIKFGTTLSNADMTIEFSSIMGREAPEQAEMRGTDVYRDDTRHIMHLVARGSIEEYFYKKIGKQEDRKQLIEGLIKHLKD